MLGQHHSDPQNYCHRILDSLPIDENQIMITTADKQTPAEAAAVGQNVSKPPVNGLTSSRPISRTDSVKNFFNKVVNQIAVSSSKVQVKIGRGAGGGGGGSSEAESKADAAQRRRAEEWRMYFEETQGRVPGVIGNITLILFIKRFCLSFMIFL